MNYIKKSSLLLIMVMQYSTTLLSMEEQEQKALGNSNAVLKNSLFTAVRTGKKKYVEWLLDNGVNPNLKDGEGYTALDRALQNGRRKIAALLSNNIVPVHKQADAAANEEDYIPLMWTGPHSLRRIKNLTNLYPPLPSPRWPNKPRFKKPPHVLD